MEFDKHEKAKSIYMELIASFVREEANTDPLITITNVSVSPSYQHVKVFFTTLPDSKEKEALIFLKRKGTELREYVKKHSRLKFIPHFDFEVDYGERNRQHIDEITHHIDEEKKDTL